MKGRFLALVVAAISVTAATVASAATSHVTQDLTGAVVRCAVNTYTLDGTIDVVIHSTVDPQGHVHYSEISTTTGLTAVDTEGVVYAVRGTRRDGYNDGVAGAGVETFTFHLAFIAPGGGVVDRESVTDHLGPNMTIIHESSRCEV
jgi:hypothetical protein